MQRQDYTDANRRMWNETARLHEVSQLEGLLESFVEPGFTTLDAVERSLLEGVGVAGKRVVQLACNNGRELVSIVRGGASEGVGVDISEVYVEHGRRLAQAAGVTDRVSFLRSDVYELPDELMGSFDIVYITVGALGWFPELDGFLRIAAGLLASGGCLVVYEMHPMLDMFDAETGLEVRHSYFEREPDECEDEGDYFEPDKKVAGKSYWFHHTMADVIGGCLASGLTVELFEEHEHDISTVFKAFEDFEKKPAMCYALVARKSC